MEERKEFKVAGKPINLVIGILVLVVFIIGLLNLASFLFWIFRVIAPILIIATAIIDFKVITNYGKWILNMFQKNPIAGIAAGVGTLVGYPLVAAFLFAKALFKKQLIETGKKEKDDEFINFEELDSKPLKIPEVRKEGRSSSSSEYEDLID